MKNDVTKQAGAGVVAMSPFEREQNYWEEERKKWERDPYTTGVVVRHKASGTQMVVIGHARGTNKQRRCAWMSDNRRYEDDFMLSELEHVPTEAGTKQD